MSAAVETQDVTQDLVRPSRRSFVTGALGAVAASAVPSALAQEPAVAGAPLRPKFPKGDPRWDKVWDAALTTLAGNVKEPKDYHQPVLFEGSTYQGIWQECGPHEALVYAQLRRFLTPRADGLTPGQIAKNNHLAFFELQKEDGQLPASIKVVATGYAQIQMVVPIAATALETAEITGDQQFMERAYKACARWDGWLRKYRNTRGTGLVEGFCTYDTGHDNSPRWKGIPNPCPDGDAKKCPPIASLPRLCPDLSATVYGGRKALAAMATALGKKGEAQRWTEDAETIRNLILQKLYVPEDGAFYDLDAQNQFVKVRSDVISRVMGEHVLDPKDAHDRAIFQNVWTKQLHNPAAFWGTYPLTSIAQDDPTFVRPIPRNSWGGATQALTALRAPRWMGFYGQEEAMRHMQTQWCEAILRNGGFLQQMDPQTGVFTLPDPGGYSPAALTFMLYASTLHKA